MASAALEIPKGLTFSAVVPFAVTNMAIISLFAGIAVTLLIVLVATVAPSQWRRPDLILSIFSTVLFLITPITTGLSQIPNEADPHLPLNRSLFYANLFLIITVPFFADLVITARIYTFFGVHSSVSRRKQLLIFAFPVAIKIVRIVGIVLFLNYVYQIVEIASSATNLRSAAGLDSGSPPELYLEYGGQFADVLYSTFICVWRIYSLAKPAKHRHIHRSATLQSRINKILRVLLASFVCPAASALALIIVVSGSNYQAISNMSAINPGIVVANVLASTILLLYRPNKDLTVEPEKIQGAQLPLNAKQQLDHETEKSLEGGQKRRLPSSPCPVRAFPFRRVASVASSKSTGKLADRKKQDLNLDGAPQRVPSRNGATSSGTREILLTDHEEDDEAEFRYNNCLEGRSAEVKDVFPRLGLRATSLSRR